MKIIKYKMICPKCGNEYENSFLASYSSGFENHAKSFTENNKIITHCKNCNIKLIQEHLIKNFDEVGNYSPKKKYIKKDIDKFDLYLEILSSIKEFFMCTENGKIIISSTLEINDNNVTTKLILKAESNNILYELASATINEYVLSIGDRKNKLVINILTSEVDTLILNIYSYIFEDECSGYKTDAKEKIICELLNNNHSIV